MLELLISYIWLTQTNNLCQNWYWSNQVKYEKYECERLNIDQYILNVKRWKNMRSIEN